MQYMHLRGVNQPIVVIHICFAMWPHLLIIGGRLLLVHALVIIWELFIIASLILLVEKVHWHKELVRLLLSREATLHNDLLALLSRVARWTYVVGIIGKVTTLSRTCAQSKIKRCSV